MDLLEGYLGGVKYRISTVLITWQGQRLMILQEGWVGLRWDGWISGWGEASYGVNNNLLLILDQIFILS